MASGEHRVLALYLPSFEYNIIVVTGALPKKVPKLVDEHTPFKINWKSVETFYEDQGFCTSINGYTSLCWLRPADPLPGFLAHEISHAIHHLFEHHGIEHASKTDEMYSLVLEYVINCYYGHSIYLPPQEVQSA